MIVGLDWDDTLVDAKSQIWLPGSRAALKNIRKRGHTFFILSERASWDGGRDQIREGLANAGVHDVEIHAKPTADRYVCDKTFEFDGDWSKVLSRIRTR